MFGAIGAGIACAMSACHTRLKKAAYMRSIGFTEKEIFLHFERLDQEERRSQAIRDSKQEPI